MTDETAPERPENTSPRMTRGTSQDHRGTGSMVALARFPSQRAQYLQSGWLTAQSLAAGGSGIDLPEMNEETYWKTLVA